MTILIFLIFADIPAPFRGADCGILRCMHAGIMDGIASGGGGKGRAPRRINGGGGACPPNGGGNGGPFRHIGGIGGSMSGWNSCGGGIGGPIGPIIPRGPCPTIGGIMRPLRLPPNPAAPDPMPFSVKSVLFPFVLDTLLLLIIGTGGVGKLKSKYPGLSVSDLDNDQLAIGAANGWRTLSTSSSSSTFMDCSSRQADGRTVCHVLELTWGHTSIALLFMKSHIFIVGQFLHPFNTRSPISAGDTCAGDG
ncbi:hypothetical protein GQX74_015304 [Glossina fuscipes]|nr:hypothetical protein GQX74_015304 [Glossina fuscipes]